MLPRVVLFNAVSVDGRTVGLPANLGLFYGLAGQFHEDVTLAGSETILVASDEESDQLADQAASAPTGILTVVDSRGRIRNWDAIKRWPFWGRYASACSRSTPQEHLGYLRAEGIETIISGDDRVDLQALLEELARRFDAKTVRIESGGTLNGVLLEQGLVDEVSVLIHPALVGGVNPKSIFLASGAAAATSARL